MTYQKQLANVEQCSHLSSLTSGIICKLEIRSRMSMAAAALKKNRIVCTIKLLGKN
jgi:hypothetical protein